MLTFPAFTWTLWKEPWILAINGVGLEPNGEAIDSTIGWLHAKSWKRAGTTEKQKQKPEDKTIWILSNDIIIISE